MKKIFVLGVVLSVLFVAQSAFAMTFQQPVKTGFSISFSQAGGGMNIRGATENNGDFYRRQYNGKTIIYDGSGKNGAVL